MGRGQLRLALALTQEKQLKHFGEEYIRQAVVPICFKDLGRYYQIKFIIWNIGRWVKSL